MLDPLDEHFGYLSDRIKLERYEAAIRQAVRSGDTVMDLGCGSGLLGLMALRAGAGRVLFVEQDQTIEVARRTINQAGFGERSEFHRTRSFELSLPGRVDVIICDHVGYFGIDYGILELLTDAKKRFLKTGGVIVPAEIELMIAPVETEAGRELVSRWRDGSVPEDFAWIGSPAANTKHALSVPANALLAEAASLGSIELGEDAGQFLQWQVEMHCSSDGTLDGLLGWFDCRLGGDISMTNSPAASDPLGRSQAFLPLEQPLSIKAGEKIGASIMARPSDHILAWTVELPERDERLSLTTFNGLLLDDEALDRSHPDRVARLNERGRARQIVLSYCDGTRTVAEIEAIVRQKHPDLFPSGAATEKLLRQVLAWDTSG